MARSKSTKNHAGTGRHEGNVGLKDDPVLVHETSDSSEPSIKPLTEPRQSSSEAIGFLDLPRELRDEIYDLIIFDTKKGSLGRTSFILKKYLLDHTSRNPLEVEGPLSMFYVNRQIHDEYLSAAEKRVAHVFMVTPSVLFHAQENCLSALPSSPAARHISIRVCPGTMIEGGIRYRDAIELKQHLSAHEALKDFISQVLTYRSVEDLAIDFDTRLTRCLQGPAYAIFELLVATIQSLPRVRRYHLSYGRAMFAQRKGADVPWESSSVIRYSSFSWVERPVVWEKLIFDLDPYYQIHQSRH